MVQPFDIPEISCLICQWARRSDLARLSSTSRLFFDCTVPLVWRSLPESAATILLRLLPDADSYLDANPNTTLVAYLLQGIRPLDAQSLVRFNFYVPHVKQLVRNYGNKQSNVVWDRLLRLVDARPILPNLEVLKVSLGIFGEPSAQSLVPFFSAYLSSTLLEIDHVRDTYLMVRLQTIPELVSVVSQRCPYTRSLSLHDLGKATCDIMELTHANELANSLGRLRKLRFLALGWVILDPIVLRSLATLLHLESIILNEAPEYWRYSGEPKASEAPLPLGSFPALQHLGLHTFFQPILGYRTWKITSCAQRLASISLRITSSTTRFTILHLLRDMCLYSPFITGLCLDCVERNSRYPISLLAPELIGILSQLPLRRLWLLGGEGEDNGPQCSSEQLARAFPNMEYLRISGCYFKFEDLIFFVKHMPQLQQLFVLTKMDEHWPSKAGLSSMALDPSPCQVYLRLRIFRTIDVRQDTTEASHELSRQQVESLAACLRALWPNGVMCEAGRRPNKNEYANWSHDVNLALRRLNETDGHGNSMVLKPRKYPRERIPPWQGGF